jgi:hypothetical protein
MFLMVLMEKNECTNKDNIYNKDEIEIAIAIIPK